jgi:hypothetical protein
LLTSRFGAEEAAKSFGAWRGKKRRRRAEATCSFTPLEKENVLLKTTVE